MHDKLQEAGVSLDNGDPIYKVGPRVMTLGFEPGGDFADKTFRNTHFQVVCRALKQNPDRCRYVSELPGKYSHFVGIEIPGSHDTSQFNPVDIRKLLNSSEYKAAKIPIILGENTFGMPVVMDLTDPRNAHIFMAGTTGSGKTTATDAMIYGVLNMPPKNRPYMIIVDAAKGGEDLGKFTHAPNLYAPLADSYDAASQVLEQLARSLSGRRKSDQRILVVVDEIPALFDKNSNPHAENCRWAIGEIAAVGRSKGVHMLLITQDASTDILEGRMKNNVKGRAALLCGPGKQTEQILGPGWKVDGSKLFGFGDMYAVINGGIQRIQAPFIDDDIISNWMDNNSLSDTNYLFDWREPESNNELTTKYPTDELRTLANAIIDGYLDEKRCYGKAKLAALTGISEHQIGKNYLPELERFGVVGSTKGKRSRDVLITTHTELGDLFRSVSFIEQFP